MQVLGAHHKRKSIEKVEPEMPKRKISGNSRTESKRKHRTEYKSIDSPQVELKAYKRKNLTILNELQSTNFTDKQSKKLHQSTNRTEETKLATEESFQKDTAQRKAQNSSVISTKESKGAKYQQGFSTNVESRQMTSRFTISHQENQEVSLTSLINQAKTTYSNPLINTARLREEQGVYVNPFQFKEGKQKQNQSSQKQEQIHHNVDGIHSKEALQNQPLKDGNDTSILNIENQKIEQNAIEDEEEKENNEGQNFDDYEFGGKNSISNDFQEEQSAGKSSTRKKPKKGKNTIMPPPTVQSYTFDTLIRPKPQNWRELNRYIPETEEQNRMAQQRLVREKQSLQLKRQQQEIMKMVQEYQQNKNSINLISQRKIQTSKIMQKIYRDKRLNKHSVSLPQLKPLSKPKHQIILSDSNTVNIEGHLMENPTSIEERFKVNNTIAKNFRPEQKPKLHQNIKGSLSYSKLGFGSSEPRLLNEEELKQSELKGIEKIQKKLRQKGISFDSASIRKGLLNVRDAPIYKISTKSNNFQSISNQQGKLDLPKKQLPTNGFYKIFPL